MSAPRQDALVRTLRLREGVVRKNRALLLVEQHEHVREPHGKQIGPALVQQRLVTHQLVALEHVEQHDQG
eukprot:4281355-Pyramimonas_sp.AAC.1